MASNGKTYANIGGNSEMKKFVIALLTAVSMLVACVKEDAPGISGPLLPRGVSFGLRYDGYSPDVHTGKRKRSFREETYGTGPDRADYDHVELVVVDEDGNPEKGWKGYYDRVSSTVHIEGLQEGGYRMLVLGIKGDSGMDGAEINSIGHVSDVWLSFPEDLARPLEAEYFYSSTPFRVYHEESPDGLVTVSDMPGEVTQTRIAGRLDFDLGYRNRYVRTAVTECTAGLENMKLYTGLRGDGSLSGESDGRMEELDLSQGQSYLFMPTAGGADMSGHIRMKTRDYRGNTISRTYSYGPSGICSNTVSTVYADVVHPEDESGTMFITDAAYREGRHGAILQDDEHHGIYTDKSLRNFNTASPMQFSVGDDGRLNVRFYSPRSVRNVLVRARIPSVSDEFIDLAFFDEVPAFADFYELLPSMERKAIYRTASGRILEVGRLDPSQFSDAEYDVVSDDPYWGKLREIRHGWNIRFDLFGGDPDRPDGGPSGNWMGIRPVHCREAVAFFLNFTYMIDMPEHERILRENQDRLYGNGGVDDKVSVETVLGQMRQTRTINVGLVYTGNSVMGLGGGSTFGAWQGGWLEHYTSLYACEVMFHELGHVMGYSHNSSFTYGPWAQELMNSFYIGHLDRMPVDSPEYLKSGSNPNIYR